MCDPNAVSERVDLYANDRVDKFIIEKKLGEGAFGDVYKVKNTESGQINALKVLKLWTTDKRTRDNLNKRFELEFITGQIASENLVQSHSYGCIKGNPYIVMEFCPNGDLRGKLDKEMSNDEITQYACDILLGLSALHQNGKCHRDLKPDNVLFDRQMRAKLTDFGISGHANIKMKLTEMDWRGRPKDQLGTWLYMPAEQVNPRNRKETILPTIDIFAFGVVCYEMFTGFYPFGALSRETLDRDLSNLIRRVQEGRWDRTTVHGVNIPPVWEEILENCFAPDYKNRYQNVDVILTMLGKRAVKAPTKPTVQMNGMCLQIMQGEEYGRVYNLSQMLGNRKQGILKLGRNDDTGAYRNDVAIREEESAYISRMHATIERNPEGWHIRNGQYGEKDNRNGWYDSLNGTYVNGIEVTAYESKTLNLNDIITIGNTTLKVMSV